MALVRVTSHGYASLPLSSSSSSSSSSSANNFIFCKKILKFQQCTTSSLSLKTVKKFTCSSSQTNNDHYQIQLCTPLANTLIAASLSLCISFSGVGLAYAKEGVNRPEMLPKEFTPLIDVAGFLSPSQERQIIQDITDLEKDTGFKLRVLAQNYPETPGLAVKDFWQVDDDTVVFVADPTFGNILNFNVGASIDLNVPRSFWSRLAGKYGNIFYWREKGEDTAIEAAVSAVTTCLREPLGPNACSEIQ